MAFMQIVTCVADIPVIRLFGQSPASMPVTGISETTVSSIQELELHRQWLGSECLK
jgi:hypothetical protein